MESERDGIDTVMGWVGGLSFVAFIALGAYVVCAWFGLA